MTTTDNAVQDDELDGDEQAPTKHYWDLVFLPDDGLGHDRHYMIRAACECGWASRDYRYWGQAHRAGVKHAER